MDPIRTEKWRVSGACSYAQWATANDLGFLIRHYIKPRGGPVRNLPAWDSDHRRWRHPNYPILDTIGAPVGATVGIHIEFADWDSAGRPDGFESANITEYWSRLDPHIRAEDDLWKGLVKGTVLLRAVEADIFSDIYRERLEAFVGEHLAPVAVKPAKVE